jgi:hypothetical protein
VQKIALIHAIEVPFNLSELKGATAFWVKLGETSKIIFIPTTIMQTTYKSVRFKQLIRDPYSAFTIDFSSSMPTLTSNLKEHSLFTSLDEKKKIDNKNYLVNPVGLKRK